MNDSRQLKASGRRRSARGVAMSVALAATLWASAPLVAFADGKGDSPAIAESETSYTGARILRKDIELNGGLTAPGIYAGTDDESESIQRYAYWQGDTLFLGAYNPTTKNSVDAVVEFYWFESSIPKSSDFYVMVVKAKTSPNALNGWKLRQEEDWWTGFWDGNKPCQLVDVNMADQGSGGSIRWDWSVPFQNYGWEPTGKIEIAQSYSVGFDGKAEGSGSGNPLGSFKEGGFLKDVSNNANIQAKGQYNKSYAVTSQYTVTLNKWQMFVQGGATHMNWNLVVNEAGSIADDTAYHEYFVVVQAPLGFTAVMESVDIAASFHKPVSYWFDEWDDLSAGAIDISFHPPVEVECYASTKAPAGYCASEGACGTSTPTCSDGTWECPTPDAYEKVEVSCDNFDNDCDGQTDENLTESCETDCGSGTSKCVAGTWTQCSAPKPEAELCDGKDNDCDGEIDNTADCMDPPDDPIGPAPECEDGDIGPSGFCGKAGVCAKVLPTCEDGEWSCEKPAAYETYETLCDNLDNDCDGDVDEGLEQACTTKCGSGTTKCEDGVWGSCVGAGSSVEVCDGIDNDCDSIVDEVPPKPCETACGPGTYSCVSGQWTTCVGPAPSAEVCDGIDNDCNGKIDDAAGCSGAGGGGEGGDDPGNGGAISDPLPWDDGGPFDYAGSGSGSNDESEPGSGCNSTGDGSSTGALFAFALLALLLRRRQ